MLALQFFWHSDDVIRLFRFSFCRYYYFIHTHGTYVQTYVHKYSKHTIQTTKLI